MTVLAKRRTLFSNKAEAAEWARYFRLREPGMVNVLVERYRPLAMRLVRDYLRRRPDCAPYRDDLTSAALVGLWSAIEAFNPDPGDGSGNYNFYSWAIFRVQTRISDVVRPNKLVGLRLASSAMERPVPDDVHDIRAHDPSEVADGRIFWQEALRRLAPTQRVAVVLHFVDGRPVDEVARWIGATPPEAETLIETALNVLRG